MTAEDMYEATRLLAAIGGNSHWVKAVKIEGAPWSKMRAKVGRRSGYAPAADKAAEERTGWHLKGMFKEPMRGNVALVCLFYRPNYQRIDTDNMLKHVCDSANGIAWVDDSQVTAVLGIGRLDAMQPRTIIAVTHHVTTLLRGTDATYPCEVCGKAIHRVGQSNVKRTCSMACSMRLRGYEPLDIPVPCEQCGQPFRRVTRTNRFCSPNCRNAHRVGSRKPSTPTVSSCLTCGKQLRHNRGGRCRDCWRANPRGVVL